MIQFYDTGAMLNLQAEIFDEFFMFSYISLIELEKIKTSSTRDEKIKWQTRHLLNLLNSHQDKYKCIIYNTNLEDFISEQKLPLNNDSRIIAQAYDCKFNQNQDIEFVTSDLSCKMLAEYLHLPARYTEEIAEDDYTGFLTIEMNEAQLADFYEDTLTYNKNIYNLNTNQYLLIKYNNEIIDKYVWKENIYEKVVFHNFDSKMFGKINSKDEYQQLAMHSLINNQITMLRGSAGTGKSYLAFGYMFDLLEQGKIDKIIIFCNTVATKGSAKLGFYPGSRTEKLLDSQIGNLLESKLGDKLIIEDLINKGKLVLLPMSDIRGYDTTGLNAAIYISEAQNLDIELMRLALQRIGEDSICIIDGDFTHQVDMSLYEGKNNGMKRVSKVFRGKSFYGEVQLQTIFRSKIAEIAEEM